jgi:hypothetical protein
LKAELGIFSTRFSPLSPPTTLSICAEKSGAHEPSSAFKQPSPKV